MLRVNNISVTFNGGTINEKNALHNLSLTIAEGQFVTVIGGNGAGKSTLLNAIAGVVEVDGGNITVDNVDVTFMPTYKRAKYISRVFQDPMKGTASKMNILENLSLAHNRGNRQSLKWSVDKHQTEYYKQMLSTLGLGLEDRLTSKVSLLSGGQRQALTLLMATIVKPKLLLLDEHTAALDPKTASKVLQLTNDITSATNQTTLMVTHNMSDALQYGDRLIMMNEGNIILDIQGDEKRNATVEQLLALFHKVGQSSDRVLLS